MGWSAIFVMIVVILLNLMFNIMEYIANIINWNDLKNQFGLYTTHKLIGSIELSKQLTIQANNGHTVREKINSKANHLRDH